VPCKASGRLAKPEATEERKDDLNKRIGFVVLDKSENTVEKLQKMIQKNNKKKLLENGILKKTDYIHRIKRCLLYILL
jgi:hypothetical protein